MKYNSAAVGALTVGINIVTANTATMVFSNNKIGGIIADYLNTVNRGHLYAISTSGAGALTLTNNIIGSETVATASNTKVQLTQLDKLIYEALQWVILE